MHHRGEPAGDDLVGDGEALLRRGWEGDGVGRRVQLLAERAERGPDGGGGDIQPVDRAIPAHGRHGGTDEEGPEQHGTEHDREESGCQPPTERHSCLLNGMLAQGE
ncbi:hypothetical protein Psuf_026770 [Phytohabitans suffuscus]|uniref:Uncharacterized protein n=1 Tax=Phytohabitans suffuscus TaxID=624315 RepID=A0A6F8YGU7_9ACTN|nr:hypothetical protein Psuf_026770 [Phytohabitans suffuscus]